MMRSNMANASVRPPAVAGLFYPEEARELRAAVHKHLEQARVVQLPAPARAFIVPHAGYIYSGGVAAQSYSMISMLRGVVRRVVLIGPSHRTYLRGAAVPQATAFRTPLGDIAIDSQGRERLLARGDVIASDAHHAAEHSLEVQLPFLQETLGDLTLLPVVVGDAAAPYTSSLLEDVWGGDDTLVLASSDLSHYLPYARAQAVDADTSRRILNRESTLSGDQACGAAAINGLLHSARARKLRVTELARLNSGDTAGDRESVVGYGAYALHA